MKAHWWHLRGKASVKGEHMVCVSLEKTPNADVCFLVCSPQLLAWHLVLQIAGVSGHRLHFPLLDFLTCDHSEQLIDSSKKGKNCWHPPVGCSIRMFGDLNPPVGKMGHASFLRLVGLGSVAGAVLPHLSMWEWSFDTQWW